MRKTSYFSLYFADFVFLAVLFLLHRALSFSSLNAGLVSGSRQYAALFVGSLSDLWIAGVLALLTAGWHRWLSQKLRPKLAAGLRGLFFVALCFALASHQSYVEFFGFTMMAFHLRYLYDPEFIMANGRSLFGWPLLLYLALILLLLLGERVSKKRPLRYPGRVFIGFLLLLGILHNRQIHWRVQWFIPENLQMNLVEKLFQQLQQRRTMDPISNEEQQRLVSLLQLPEKKVDFPGLLREVKAEAGKAQQPIQSALEAAWRTALQQGRKPIIAVLLMESLRPSETGFFAPGTVSLTPYLDQLAQRAIVFRNAYSTGSVTRGGQEAVFCGHISSRDTSLMRFDAVAPIRCLSDILKQPLADGSRIETFWYHGGNGLFDNQISFWRKHGIQQFISQDDFPPDTPHTSWGVGDISFLQRSAGELLQRRQQSKAQAFAGLFLTVSNHIPWDLPADIVPRPLPDGVQHPSYRTTAYADQAIGVFIQRLKSEGLWQDMLLVLASDHGNQLPAYQDIYPDAGNNAARLQSHINLMLAGGLAEKALASQQLQNLQLSQLVSQVDISEFIAQTLGLADFHGMGENLFQKERRLPVLSRLEQHLFDPASQTLMDPPAWQARPPAGEREKDLLYYRAYIDYISSK